MPTLEEAWNSGVSSTFYIPLANRTITLNAEYYYTDFISQPDYPICGAQVATPKSRVISTLQQVPTLNGRGRRA